MRVQHRQPFLSHVTHYRADAALLPKGRGCRPVLTSKRIQRRENHVVWDLHSRVPHPNYRLGDRSQLAPCASEVDRCGNNLSNRLVDYSWCDGYSTKGSSVLRVFLASRFAARGSRPYTATCPRQYTARRTSSVPRRACLFPATVLRVGGKRRIGHRCPTVQVPSIARHRLESDYNGGCVFQR